MKPIAAAKAPHRHERGQSLVELALSLTVMLLLLSGAVTFGMALFSYVAIRDAAGEGALFGSISPYVDGSNGYTPADGQYQVGEDLNWLAICNRVKAASNSPVDMSGFQCRNDDQLSHSINAITVWATQGAGTFCEGNTPVNSSNANGIRVTVDYFYPIMMPYIGGIIQSQTIHLRATVTNTILEPRCP